MVSCFQSHSDHYLSKVSHICSVRTGEEKTELKVEIDVLEKYSCFLYDTNRC